MAQIEITPLNISGVKLPSNLLDNILGQQIDYTNLVYPMDLATNPQYCHAVQFTIYDYDYPAIDAAYQQLSGVIGQGLGQIATAIGKAGNGINQAQIQNVTIQGLVNSGLSSARNIFGSLQNMINTTSGKELGGLLSNVYRTTNIASPLQSGLKGLQNITSLAPAELGGLWGSYGNLFQPSTYMTRTKTKLASVSLYMPDSLQTNITSNYDPVSLTETFGIAGYGANAISDYMKNKDSLTSNPTNILSKDLVAIGAANAGNFGAVIGNAIKQVPNPQVQLIYRGVALREFQFEFTFTPASQKEAQEIDEIIKTFTYYSLPKLTDHMNGQFFIPPQIFGIKFAFLGSDGVAGQIYDIFKNNITNLIGNQFTKILSGSNPADDIASSKQAKIFQIGDCVLKDIQVNYAPNGWASYTDGYPIQTTISLTFGEINLINKDTNGVKPSKVPSSGGLDSGMQSILNKVGVNVPIGTP